MDTDVTRLDAYLNRIGYSGLRQPDLETLAAIHRAHLTSIAYENLDIHLGRALSLDFERIFDKIVRRGRGGWCYEMNTLLGWALREMGFDLTVMGAAVGAKTEEGRQLMDHMVLRVMLDEPWLVDAGFGNAFLTPLPLVVGVHQQAHYTYHLQRDGDYWSYSHLHGGPGFDFLLQPRSTHEFADRCRWLQTSPESSFVKVAVCFRFLPDHSILTLRGVTLTLTHAAGKAQQVLETIEEYRKTLVEDFGLQLSDEEIRTLWARVWPAHLAWVQAAQEGG